MASTNVVGAGAAARPVPGATWRGRVHDATAISVALNRLWAQFGGEPSAGAQARASTLNLTVVTRSRRGAGHAIDAVTRLSNLYPSRATILVANHERGTDADPGLDVEITLLEQAATRGRLAVRFECITVEVSAENAQQLASITSPLLVADLPDFLWWAGGDTGGDLFDDLTAITDRLIVDTATIAAPSGELTRLSALVRREEGNLRLSDFAWARIKPWRHLVTQFFDPPACRPALHAIDNVAIVYRAADVAGKSALSGALLLAGWLGSRLGWQAPGELVPIRSTPGGWRATLRAGERGRRRETLLTLLPTANPAAGCCLERVTLSAQGIVSGVFRVERTDRLGLTTTSEMAKMTPISRGIFAPVADEAVLLAAELQVFGRDLVYEAALAFAAVLAPDLATMEHA
ncbi:MAG: glucose-6-phosphate dehydrogenase assembly protein OpcA [Chloroflexota bacterium]|nr:glucose-6-phosphate dehydrogenase assembly protein OpcA [Chloroflexota bacterium]